MLADVNEETLRGSRDRRGLRVQERHAAAGQALPVHPAPDLPEGSRDLGDHDRGGGVGLLEAGEASGRLEPGGRLEGHARSRHARRPCAGDGCEEEEKGENHFHSSPQRFIKAGSFFESHSHGASSWPASRLFQ